MQRPTGVTILAILAIIFGALALIGGALGIFAGAAINSGALNTSTTNTTLTGSQVIAVSAVALVLGVLDIVWGVGALRLRPWAWTLGIGIAVLNIADGVVSVVTKNSSIASAAIGIILSVAILLYLFSARVRTAFGR